MILLNFKNTIYHIICCRKIFLYSNKVPDKIILSGVKNIFRMGKILKKEKWNDK